MYFMIWSRDRKCSFWSSNKETRNLRRHVEYYRDNICQWWALNILFMPCKSRLLDNSKSPTQKMTKRVLAIWATEYLLPIKNKVLTSWINWEDLNKQIFKKKHSFNRNILQWCVLKSTTLRDEVEFSI